MSNPDVPATEQGDVTISETTVSVGVPVSDLVAVLQKYEHDLVGTVHWVWADIKALIAKAKAAV